MWSYEENLLYHNYLKSICNFPTKYPMLNYGCGLYTDIYQGDIYNYGCQ